MNVSNIMTTDLSTVTPTASIDRAISLMEQEEIHHLCVVDAQKLVGIVSDRDILISTGWMLAIERNGATKSGTNGRAVRKVSQIMSSRVDVLEETDDIREAANLMVTHRVSAVPILSKTRLAGIVTDADLVRCLGDIAVEGNAAWKFLNAAVRTLMTAPVITVVPSASLDEVIDVFKRFHIRHVPVATGKKLQGIISDRDVRRALGWSAARDAQAEAQGRVTTSRIPEKAEEIMQTSVTTITASATLGEALQRMQSARIHSLPVVDDGALIGIITQTDFVNALVQEQLT